jgi:hypothetical protein
MKLISSSTSLRGFFQSMEKSGRRLRQNIELDILRDRWRISRGNFKRRTVKRARPSLLEILDALLMFYGPWRSKI